jgi:hypothetical protein
MSIARTGGGGEYLRRDSGRLPRAAGVQFENGDRVIMRDFRCKNLMAFWVPGETGTLEQKRGLGHVLVRLDSSQALIHATQRDLIRIPAPRTAATE